MSDTAGAPAAGEEPLVGDGATLGIVRIGETVHRPVRPFTRTVLAFWRICMGRAATTRRPLSASTVRDVNY